MADPINIFSPDYTGPLTNAQKEAKKYLQSHPGDSYTVLDTGYAGPLSKFKLSPEDKKLLKEQAGQQIFQVRQPPAVTQQTSPPPSTTQSPFNVTTPTTPGATQPPQQTNTTPSTFQQMTTQDAIDMLKNLPYGTGVSSSTTIPLEGVQLEGWLRFKEKEEQYNKDMEKYHKDIERWQEAIREDAIQTNRDIGNIVGVPDYTPEQMSRRGHVTFTNFDAQGRATSISEMPTASIPRFAPGLPTYPKYEKPPPGRELTMSVNKSNAPQKKKDPDQPMVRARLIFNRDEKTKKLKPGDPRLQSSPTAVYRNFVPGGLAADAISSFIKEASLTMFTDAIYSDTTFSIGKDSTGKDYPLMGLEPALIAYMTKVMNKDSHKNLRDNFKMADDGMFYLRDKYRPELTTYKVKDDVGNVITQYIAPNWKANDLKAKKVADLYGQFNKILSYFKDKNRDALLAVIRPTTYWNQVEYGQSENDRLEEAIGLLAGHILYRSIYMNYDAKGNELPEPYCMGEKSAFKHNDHTQYQNLKQYSTRNLWEHGGAAQTAPNKKSKGKTNKESPGYNPQRLGTKKTPNINKLNLEEE